MLYRANFEALFHHSNVLFMCLIVPMLSIVLELIVYEHILTLPAFLFLPLFMFFTFVKAPESQWAVTPRGRQYHRLFAALYYVFYVALLSLNAVENPLQSIAWLDWATTGHVWWNMLLSSFVAFGIAYSWLLWKNRQDSKQAVKNSQS